MPVSRLVAWGLWLVAAIFYAYQYVLRVMPNIMMADIIQQFHIDTAVFGQFSGIYYIGYALMHLPIGIMLDRFGARKVMTGCILLTVIGLLPIIFATNWVFPIIGRLLIGIGSSAAILGTFKIIRMAFNVQQFTKMLSFAVTIGLIGAIYGGGPLNYLCENFGYKLVVEMFAIFGGILAVLTYLIVPEIETSASSSIKADIMYVISNAKVISICLLAGLMVAPLEGFADVWGAGFLQRVYGIESSTSSYLSSLIFVGMCFGAPCLSFIAEKSKNYLAVIMICALVMAFSFLFLVLGVMTTKIIAVSFLLIGMCSAYQILAIFKASTYVPEHIAGLTTAVANMIIMSFGYCFHTAIGLIVDACGGIQVTQAYVYGISIIPATLFISSIGFFILLWQDKKCQTAKPIIL